jgi:hypothetical protein
MTENIQKLMDLLDHMELVNWIQYMSYPAAKIGKTLCNLDGRAEIILPSGKRIKITIRVEELE